MADELVAPEEQCFGGHNDGDAEITMDRKALVFHAAFLNRASLWC